VSFKRTTPARHHEQDPQPNTDLPFPKEIISRLKRTGREFKREHARSLREHQRRLAEEVKEELAEQLAEADTEYVWKEEPASLRRRRRQCQSTAHFAPSSILLSRSMPLNSKRRWMMPSKSRNWPMTNTTADRFAIVPLTENQRAPADCIAWGSMSAISQHIVDSKVRNAALNLLARADAASEELEQAQAQQQQLITTGLQTLCVYRPTGPPGAWMLSRPNVKNKRAKMPRRSSGAFELS
jgi:hypothetical protein